MENYSVNADDVQKIVLALLVSRKDPLSLQSLAKDYFDQEGESIPWKELGYASLLDYLKSISNCVSLEKINGTYYARGIANKSKHISSLVARQKTFAKNQSCVRKYRPSQYYPITSTPKIYVPANILSDLILMIKQSPHGINKDYALKWLDNKLPELNLCITDLENIVKNMSHKIYTDRHRIFSFENENISDKFWGIKTSLTEENEYLQFKNYVKSRYVVSGDTESEKESDGDVKKNQMMKSKDNKKQIFKNQPISTFIEKTPSNFHKQDDYMQLYNSASNTSLDNHLQKYHEEDITLFDKKNIRLLISDKNMYRLEKLIEKHPNGIWCADLPKKYLEEYHVPLNYDELGFSSVREFASCLPEIFHCKKLSQSEDFILYNAKDELIDINEKIPPKKVGSYTQSHLIENETNALPVVLSNNTSNRLIPEGVMTLGESVEQIYVKNLLNGPQQCVEVYVEEVFTPSLFWIQLRKERKHFSKLMDALHIFYEENFLNYKIPIAVLEKGLNCACKYDNIWHRGIIKSVRYDLHVTVMFYDFGTLKTYSPDEIFYLHRSFSYLPAQAIPCGLYNIKPRVGEKWSQNVTQEFANKIYEQPLVATIVSTDPENNSMLVTLTDTQKEEDVHINDWMIHQNLAICGQMVRIRPRNFPFYYYLESKGINNINIENLNSSTLDISNTNETSTINLFQNINKRSLSTSLQNDCKSDITLSNSKNCTQLLEKSNNFIQNNHSKISTIFDDQLQVLQNSKQYFSDIEVLSSTSEKSELVSNVTEKQEHKDIPLPKRYFTNLLNYSQNLQSKYQNYDVSPDDNIVPTIKSDKLISNFNNYIDLKDIKIGVPEIIISTLRTDKSQVNDQSSVNAIQNTKDSLNHFEQLKSCNDLCKLVNKNNLSSMIKTNQKSDNVGESSKTRSQLYNECNEDTKLNVNDYFNLENCDDNSNNNNNSNEIKKEVLDVRTNKENFNSISRKNIKENNLMKIASRLRSLLKIKNFNSECTEQHKSTETSYNKQQNKLNKNQREENLDNDLKDNNDECNIENKVNGFYGKKNGNEEEEIGKVNDNKSLEEDKNYNNDDCKDNLVSQMTKIEMIEDVQHISSSDIDCLNNSDNISKIERNIEQAKDSSTMPLMQSNIVEQKDELNEHLREEHKLILEKSCEEIIQADDNDLEYDNDDKWSVVGNLDDFILGKAILSSLSVNPMINNDGNE